MNSTELLQAEAAIIGSGPAGLAAAIELRRQGIGPVIVIERESEAGGIPRHCAHPVSYTHLTLPTILLV